MRNFSIECAVVEALRAGEIGKPAARGGARLDHHLS